MTKEKWLVALKGMAMGMAEVVPGVSGGTIAFISGIYERLLNSIGSIEPSLLNDFREGGIARVAQKVDFTFMVTLALGMFAGIVIGIFGIHFFMENYPPAVWSFFFGLILASFFYLLAQIDQKSIQNIILIIIGTVLAVAICLFVPARGSDHLGYVFISGFLAISALLLPGISGSFILLLLGMYLMVTGRVKSFLSGDMSSDNFLFLGVLALGCLTGVVVLSRVLSYALDKYKDLTLSLLTGFVGGSLLKIWPWQNPLLLLHKETAMEVPFLGVLDHDTHEVISQSWVWPTYYYADPMVGISVIFFVLGLLLVLLLSRLDHQ